jgi:hypothetical protein
VKFTFAGSVDCLLLEHSESLLSVEGGLEVKTVHANWEVVAWGHCEEASVRVLVCSGSREAEELLWNAAYDRNSLFSK